MINVKWLTVGNVILMKSGQETDGSDKKKENILFEVRTMQKLQERITEGKMKVKKEREKKRLTT